MRGTTGIGINVDRERAALGGDMPESWDVVFRPEITKRLENYDPGNEYAVNYMWGTTGLGINLDRVQQALGTEPANTWDIVFKPELLAKFASCGVHFLDAADELIPTALRWLGLDTDSKNTADIEKAGEVLMKVRANVRKFHSSEYINALANNEICLAVGWSGDILQAKTRADEAAAKTKRKAPRIDYVLPKEGAHMWFDSFAIPKDAPNVENAHLFLNYMLRPDVIAECTNYTYYANGNQAAKALVLPEILEDPAIYPDAETQKRMFPSVVRSEDVQRVVTREWTRLKTGQ